MNLDTDKIKDSVKFADGTHRNLVLLVVSYIVIFYLFLGLRDLNNKFIDYIASDGKRTVEEIKESTESRRENTTVLKEIKEVLIKNQK